MNSTTTLSLNMGQMMALSGYKVKTGKLGFPCRHGKSAKFSRLFKFAGIPYAHLLMPRQPEQIKLKVIWETAPNPDPHALLKAVAMLFGRRTPLSTDADLTKADKTLTCGQRPSKS